MHSFKYIYGPVYSWRLGRSLGIDPLSAKEKICNFDCIYCQLGKTHRFENERKEFIPTSEIVREINLIQASEKIDHLTFSGRGEPTLAKNLGDMIKAIKKIRPEPIAVITNSALIHFKDVQEDLALSDFVLAKLDACSQDSLSIVDKAMGQITFTDIIEGMISFQKIFKGKLALQIMFMKENLEFAPQIAQLVRKISPDEVELNTPTRSCAITPLGRSDIEILKSDFKGLNVVSVYDAPVCRTASYDEKATSRRHGKSKKETSLCTPKHC